MWSLIRDFSSHIEQQQQKPSLVEKPPPAAAAAVKRRAYEEEERIEEEEHEPKHVRKRRQPPPAYTRETLVRDLQKINSSAAFRAALERHKALQDRYNKANADDEGEEKKQEEEAEEKKEEVYASMLKGMEDLTISREKDRLFSTRVQLSTEAQLENQRNAGDARLDEIRRTLNSLGLRRSRHQKQFHDHFLRACLPIVYGEEWELSSERVLRELGIPSVNPEVMIITPRRFGKTFSVAMFACALLLCCPGVKIAVFSTGRRASSGLMSEILRRMNHVPGASRRILKKTEEELYISATELGEDCKMGGSEARARINRDDTSVLKSYPAGTATLRGVGANVVILEEAAFMPPATFFEVIVPLLGVRNTAVLAISTPQDERNYYTVLTDLEDADGKPLFKCFKLGLSCKACEKAKRKCKHKLNMNPPWKPRERQDKVDKVLEAHPVLRERETRGMICSTTMYVLEPEVVDAFKDRPPYVFPDGRPNVLFTAIDPSGGGTGSDFAMVTVAFHEGHPVIVHMARNENWRSGTIDAFILKYFQKIRQHKRYESSYMLVYIEANMGWDKAERYATQVIGAHPEFGPLRVVREEDKGSKNKSFDKEPRYGVWTFPETKAQWEEVLLAHTPRTCFAQDYIGDLPTRELFIRQLRQFRKESSQNANPDMQQFARMVLTGKNGHEKDDLVAAYCIAMQQSYKTIAHDPLFRTERKQLGLSTA